MTHDELQERLAYWQKRLRLADWHIVVKFATPHELGSKSGDSTADFEARCAQIRILPAEQFNPNWLAGPPVEGEEETLVHELLHCVFAGFQAKPGTLKDSLQHQAVWSLAYALLEEHRREAA